MSERRIDSGHGILWTCFPACEDPHTEESHTCDAIMEAEGIGTFVCVCPCHAAANNDHAGL